MSVLGKRLKEARLNKKFNQIEAAKILGISNGTLSGYERNYRDPDTIILEKMAELYDVSLDYLLGRTDDPMSTVNNALQKFSEKDERGIAKRMEQMKKDLIEASSDGDGLNYMGEPMSEEAIESLLEALEHAERIATLTNKKYTPKKYNNKN